MRKKEELLKQTITWKTKIRKAVRMGLMIMLVAGNFCLQKSGIVRAEGEHQLSFLRQEVAHIFLRGAGGADRGEMEEAVLAVDGRPVFCMEPYAKFQEGKGQKIPLEKYQVEESLLKRLGLETYYITQLSPQKNTDAGYILAQIHLWKSLSPYKGWDCGETYAAEYVQLTPVFEEARQWAEKHSGYYQVWLQLYQATGGGQITMEVQVKKYGSLRLRKESAQSEMTEKNPAYSLEGAEYGVYQEGTKELVATLVTDKTGEAEVFLPEGRYEVKERKAPTGYALDATVYPVEVKWEEEVLLNKASLKEQPQYETVGLLLEKTDKETGKPVSQGGASLAGARFEVAFYPGYYKGNPIEEGGKPERKWIVKTDKKGQAFLREEYLVSGDELYRNKERTPVLPLGTVTIREIKPPEGYLPDQGVYVRKLVGYGKEESVQLYETVKIREQIIRGDLEGVKIEASTARRMGNVRFRITSASTGEAHEILTDENGYFSTAAEWHPHTRHTNRGQEAGDGIWFGGGEAKDTAGALPFDTYILDELEGQENQGKKLIQGLRVVVSRDRQKVLLGTISNESRPESDFWIRTQAQGSSGKKEILPQKHQTFQDMVEFEGRNIKDKEVLIRGQVMRKSSRSPLEINGKEVITEKRVRISGEKGQAELEFEVDATGLAGEELVLFESVYDSSGKLLGKETDYENPSQTIRVRQQEEPSVGQGVKTGDVSHLPLLISLIASGAVTGFVWNRRRR